MKFFNFSSPAQITVEQIKDFYRYSEIAQWKGQSNRKADQFGSNIEIDGTHENSEWHYEGIWLFGAKKWAYISIEDENVILRYLETDYMPLAEDCPITTNAKQVSLITKCFLNWYKELNLPNTINEIQKQIAEHEAVSVIKEIEINVFDGAVLRLLSDKTAYLIFNTFPPDGGKLTKNQIDNFDKLLAEAIKKKVVHDDRELFIIYDDSQKTIDDITSFLHGLNT